MSERLPRVTGADLQGALQRAGWYVDHWRGSHCYLRQAERPGVVVVPEHAGRTLKLGTLTAILEPAGLSAEQLRKLL